VSFASFTLYKCTGVPSSVFDTSKHLYFLYGDGGNSDSSDTSSYSIPVPAVDGTAVSWENWLRYQLVQEPDNSVSNVGVYFMADVVATGVYIMAGTINPVEQRGPTSLVSTVAYVPMSSSYFGPNDYLAIPCSTDGGTLVSAGDKTYWFVLQMHVGVGAPRGNLPQMLFYGRYNEN